MDELNSATNSLIWNGLKIIGVICVLSLLFTGFLWIMKPTEKAIDHQVNVESHQYQEARKEAAIILEQEIAKLDVQIAKAESPEVKSALIEQREVLIRRHARETSKIRRK